MSAAGSYLQIIKLRLYTHQGDKGESDSKILYEHYDLPLLSMDLNGELKEYFIDDKGEKTQSTSEKKIEYINCLSTNGEKIETININDWKKIEKENPEAVFMIINGSKIYYVYDSIYLNDSDEGVHIQSYSVIHRMDNTCLWNPFQPILKPSEQTQEKKVYTINTFPYIYYLHLLKNTSVLRPYNKTLYDKLLNLLIIPVGFTHFDDKHIKDEKDISLTKNYEILNLVNKKNNKQQISTKLLTHLLRTETNLPEAYISPLAIDELYYANNTKFITINNKAQEIFSNAATILKTENSNNLKTIVNTVVKENNEIPLCWFEKNTNNSNVSNENVVIGSDENGVITQNNKLYGPFDNPDSKSDFKLNSDESIAIIVNYRNQATEIREFYGFAEFTTDNQTPDQIGTITTYTKDNKTLYLFNLKYKPDTTLCENVDKVLEKMNESQPNSNWTNLTIAANMAKAIKMQNETQKIQELYDNKYANAIENINKGNKILLEPPIEIVTLSVLDADKNRSLSLITNESNKNEVASDISYSFVDNQDCFTIREEIETKDNTKNKPKKVEVPTYVYLYPLSQINAESSLTLSNKFVFGDIPNELKHKITTKNPIVQNTDKKDTKIVNKFPLIDLNYSSLSENSNSMVRTDINTKDVQQFVSSMSEENQKYLILINELMKYNSEAKNYNTIINTPGILKTKYTESNNFIRLLFNPSKTYYYGSSAEEKIAFVDLIKYAIIEVNKKPEENIDIEKSLILSLIFRDVLIKYDIDIDKISDETEQNEIKRLERDTDAEINNFVKDEEIKLNAEIAKIKLISDEYYNERDAQFKEKTLTYNKKLQNLEGQKKQLEANEEYKILTTEINIINKDIVKLKKNKKKQDELNELNEELKTKTKELQQYKNPIDNKQKEITNLKSEYQKQQTEFEVFKTNYNAQETTIKELKKEYNTKTANKRNELNIKLQKTKNVELQKIVEKRKAYYNTLSAVTFPVKYGLFKMFFESAKNIKYCLLLFVFIHNLNVTIKYQIANVNTKSTNKAYDILTLKCQLPNPIERLVYDKFTAYAEAYIKACNELTKSQDNGETQSIRDDIDLIYAYKNVGKIRLPKLIPGHEEGFFNGKKAADVFKKDNTPPTVTKFKSNAITAIYEEKESTDISSFCNSVSVAFNCDLAGMDDETLAYVSKHMNFIGGIDKIQSA